MEVILLKDIENLGTRYETITVKNGFGRNYLIPQRMAVIANKVNTNKVQQKLKSFRRIEEKRLEEITKLVDKLKEVKISVGAKVGTTGKIFGSVTNVQLAEAIKKTTGIEVDRKKIMIEEDIKTLGSYTAHLDLHKDVKHSMEFDVVAE